MSDIFIAILKNEFSPMLFQNIIVPFTDGKAQCAGGIVLETHRTGDCSLG